MILKQLKIVTTVTIQKHQSEEDILHRNGHIFAMFDWCRKI